MFRFFKRSKIEKWEVELLLESFRQIGIEKTQHYIDQVKAGLFRNILLNASDIPGFHSFGYNYDIYKKFKKPNEKGFFYSGIKVFDKKSKTYLNYSIYFYEGLITGYSIPCKDKYIIDVSKTDAFSYKVSYRTNEESSVILKLLSTDERKMIDENDIYPITLKGKEFYHIRDIEDGDFIAIDKNKNLYKITHDPFEIKLLIESFEDVLNKEFI